MSQKETLREPSTAWTSLAEENRPEPQLLGLYSLTTHREWGLQQDAIESRTLARCGEVNLLSIGGSGEKWD